ncbi:MAG TPA: carbohydrate ABC transporter permease, partial [Spirochaetia bacterium]|nr:carbohydrate ABC transporter permease [Spirochaetia bacterium]
MIVLSRRRLNSTLYHILCMVLVFFMVYPVLWMIMSSFKTQSGIFRGNLSLIPDEWHFANYVEGWQGFGNYSFAVFFTNSFIISVVSTVGTMASAALVAYGFARIKFPGSKPLFTCMLITMMLPYQIIMIPQYLIFHRLNWINTFLPLIVPWSLGNPFFIFLVIQFMRTIPFELDESAVIDGCTKFGIFSRIILPLCKPALITVAIFSFYWRWEDFLQPVIYLSKPKLYTVSVALRLFSDPTSVTNWGAMFAMASLSLIPVMA